MEADEIIRNSTGKKIYVGPMLAPLAIKRNLPHIDNGNREYITGYINARRNDTFKLSPLLSWLAAPNPGGPERTSLADVLEGSDIVICEWYQHCPNKGTHQFVRILGNMTSAFNGTFVVKLYIKIVRENKS
jgi:hypothetical protein